MSGHALIHHGIVENTTAIDMIANGKDVFQASQVMNVFPTSVGVNVDNE